MKWPGGGVTNQPTTRVMVNGEEVMKKHMMIQNRYIKTVYKLTLNSSKSIDLSPVSSRPSNIFSMFSSERSSVIDLRKRTTSGRVREPLPSQSILLIRS